MVLEEVGPGAGPDSLLEEEWGVFALMDEEFRVVASIFESRLHDDDFRDENLFELDDASSHEPIDGGEVEETRIGTSATTSVDDYGPCGHPLTAMELHGAYNHRPIRQILRTTGHGVLGLRLQTGVDHGGAILSSREITMAHLQAIDGCRVCIAGKTNARPQKALRERRAAIELPQCSGHRMLSVQAQDQLSARMGWKLQRRRVPGMLQHCDRWPVRARSHGCWCLAVFGRELTSRLSRCS